ncbi:MAG: hypothetical protein H6700_08520 [Myxococcales bacterium]|nr:hypothetical protein [Myxococcales bacterium]
MQIASRILAAAPLVTLASLAIAGSTAQAQDLTADPLFGTVTLEAGFVPDPHVVHVTAGGDLELPTTDIRDAATGAACVGFVASAQPDVRLHYSGGTLLQIGARSAVDTTLLVNLPDGSWRCVDDTFALDPALAFQPAPSGQYDIWVGTVQDATAPAELLVTEFEGSTAWQSGAPATSAAGLGDVLDAAQPAVWGETSLDAGFLPDPFSTSFMAAGSVDLAAAGVAPVGFTSRAPSYTINYDGSDYLRFYATSDADTMILVHTPSGEVLFNDDSASLNPEVAASPAPAGAYHVWVGTVAAGAPASAELFVTELE